MLADSHLQLRKIADTLGEQNVLDSAEVSLPTCVLFSGQRPPLSLTQRRCCEPTLATLQGVLEPMPPNQSAFEYLQLSMLIGARCCTIAYSACYSMHARWCTVSASLLCPVCVCARVSCVCVS